MVDRYNEAKGKGGFKRPKAAGGESGGAHEPSGHDEIKQAVDEHGVAHSHHIMKTAQGYHSITHHEDGHVHHADHGSIQDAHEHGAHAMDDADHLGDMPKDDEQVEREKDEEEMNPSRKTTNVGFMS